jgi:hypothetical protein
LQDKCAPWAHSGVTILPCDKGRATIASALRDRRRRRKEAALETVAVHA